MRRVDCSMTNGTGSACGQTEQSLLIYFVVHRVCVVSLAMEEVFMHWTPAVVPF